MIKPVPIGSMSCGDGQPLLVIAGPCVIEDQALVLDVARFLKELTSELGLSYVFKSSYDKGNRTSYDSYRGPGLKKGLAILQTVREKVDVPVLSDVHSVEEARIAAEVLDIIQIPALLSRQTDLIRAAARTGKVINVKKGQFLAPLDIEHVVAKITSEGNEKILITERGSSFGYNNLVVDMRALPLMRAFGYPVIFDATHSIQLPGAGKGRSGGQRELAEPLARAAVAAGVDGVFMEVHPDPDRALCDGPNSLSTERCAVLLRILKEINEVVKQEDLEVSQ